jgi:tetratricopeptide (TPR) repeat protein
MVWVMKIDNEFKDSVTMNNMLGNYEENYRKLFKIYNSKIEDSFDRWYIIYSLALVNKKMGLIDNAKLYIDECLSILDTFDEKKYEKGCSVWLYIELYKNDLSYEETLKKYTELQEYFTCLGEDSYAYLGAVANVCILKNDYIELIRVIDTCLSNRYNGKRYIEVVTNIMNDISKNNIELFNKVNEYLNKLKIKLA